MRMLIILAAAWLAACTQIDTGNVGVEATFGQVKPDPLPPGLYQTVFKTVYEVSAREVPIELNNLSPKTKDNVTLQDMDVTAYVKVDATKASAIMIKYAGDLQWYKEGGSYLVGLGLATRTAREAAYKAAAQWASSDIHQRRTEVAEQIRQEMQDSLDADAGPKWFLVTNVVVRSILTDPKLEAAIKEAAEVEFQIRAKKQQVNLAQAEAERKRIEAEGEARANQIIANSLTNPLLELRRIEMQKEFAKEGTHTVLMGNATPLVGVGK